MIRSTSGIPVKPRIADVIGEDEPMVAGIPVRLRLLVPPDTELDMAIISTQHVEVNQATDIALSCAVVAGGTVYGILPCLSNAAPRPFI